VLDAILFQYINLKKGPEEIIQSGFDRELVLSVLRRVNRNEYKRYQAPPILRVSEKSCGAGRRFPIVGKYLE
jgi:NAD+ synthase (glutamine-hydrolysing)